MTALQIKKISLSCNLFLQQLINKYWLPFTTEKGRQFPSAVDSKFRSAMKRISFTIAESYQQALLWKIFGYWTPQRSGRIADFIVGQTIFYDSEEKSYYFKEAISTDYLNLSSDRRTKGQKGIAVREDQHLITARFPRELTPFFDFQLFVIRNVIRRRYQHKLISTLMDDPIFFINRNKQSVKGDTLNYWLTTVSGHIS